MRKYRELLENQGITILLDIGTKKRRTDIEVRLLLLYHRGAIGLLVLGNQYDASYAPLDHEPGGPDQQATQIRDRIRWFASPQECYDLLRTAGNGFWTAHRVGRDDPFLVNGFLLDVGNLLRQEFGVRV